ncbi:MAG: putative rane protein [Firmicutes bacterium]|nr:putative rane protein [Bacillota bacterium]
MNLTVRKMAITGMLGAVSIVLGVTRLGFIPVPTAAGTATIMHVPVILAAVAEGPIVGGLVGLIFGIFSLMQPSSPMFADPLVAVLPRIIIGITAAYAFLGLRRFKMGTGLVAAAVVGTLTNTCLVLGMAVLRGYLPRGVALTVGVIHGLPEIIVAAAVTLPVGLALVRAGYVRRQGYAPRPGDAA